MRKVTSDDEILDAAVAVAAREGASRLTIEAVAREVGLSKAGLIYRFPGKDALLSALLKRLLTRIELEDEHGTMVCPLQGQNLDTFRCMLRDEPHLLHAILTAGTQNPELLDPFRQFLDTKHALMRAQTSDPVLGLVLMAALDGVMLQHLLSLPPRDPETREAVLDRIEKMMSEIGINT